MPVFFIVGGPGLLILLAVLLVACFEKFVGAASAARLTGATKREAAALGVLLNARGLTELVILNVGLALGVLDSRLFTAMVVMAVVTTIMTGPLPHRFHPTAGPLSVHSVEATRTCTAKTDRGLVPSQDDTG